jgi:outer membrane autotransporter protein
VIHTNGNLLGLTGTGITNSSGTMQTIDNSGTLAFINGSTVIDSAGGGVTIMNSNEVFFSGSSSGGDGAFVNVGTGASIDISLLDNTVSGTTLGSIAGNGTILLGSKNLTVGSNNNSTLFSGIISDGGEGGGAGGSLTKVGTGTLILTGQNTYTGLTTVSAGILNIQDGSALGATTTGTIVSSGATLRLQGGISVATEALTISGAGAAGQNGALVNVSGTNNYGGLLTLGAVSTISSNSGRLNLTNTGTITGSGLNLTLTGSGIGSISSIIGTGTGTVTKNGSGQWTLSGANTYTGATTVNGGSLIVDGSISSAQTSVNNGGRLIVDGLISGAQTSVNNGGRLIVDGLISSAQTFVNAGGLLFGDGSVNGNLLNRGFVSPGHSPGTLTVNGNYTQTAIGTLHIELAGTAPGQFDLLAVGGHASLAGTLQLSPVGNFKLQVGDKITFLSAGHGVSGTFSTIQNPFVSNTLVKAEIIYLPTAVQLEGTQGSFTEFPCNPNALAVAKVLDSVVGDPRAAGLIAFLDTEPLSELCPDLNLISPEELTSIFNIGVSLANIQTVNLERRMDDIRAGSRGFSASGFAINGSTPNFSGALSGPTGPEGKSGPSVLQPTPENRWGVFVTGLGEFTNVDSTSNAPGFDLTTGGLTLGVDYRVSSNFAIGLTGGYAHTNAELVDNGDLDVNGGKVGLYATAFGGGFYADAATIGGFDGYDTDRAALLGNAHGSTDGAEFTALVACGYDWKTGGLSIGPIANFQYTYVDFDGFTENGSLAPLKFNGQNADSIRTSVGLKTSYDWKVGSVLVRPEIRAAWQHEFGDTEYSIVSSFANGAGSSFTVNGPAIGRDSLLIGAGAAVLLNDRVSVYAYYDGELARTNYSSNNVSAGVRVTF